MKKALSILLSLVLCFGMFTIINVSAANTAAVSMGNVTGNIGDTVSVDLMLDSNTGFTTLGVNVNFDTSKLQLMNVINKKVFSNGSATKPFTNTGTDTQIATIENLELPAEEQITQHVPYLITWQDNLTNANTIETGRLATFQFKILATATVGANPLTISIKNFYDKSMVNGTATVTSGSVIVPNTITFDSTGGSAVPKQTGAVNTTIPAPTAPTKTGYTFNGWFTAATGGTAITFPYTITGDTTLYAQWTVGNYAVTFNSDGGTAVATVNADYNTTIPAPTAPTKANYTFKGWFAAATGGTAITFPYTVTAATTLYAQWTPVNYTVTFDSNGGTPVASINADYNTSIATAPTAPTKTGFTFAGWYTALTGGTAVTFPYTVTGATTVYAHWADVVYVVTFNTNGGSAIANANVANNLVVAKPADPTKTGYTFGGWYKDAALATAWNFTTDTITANTTIYAKWVAVPYTVTFNTNGGTAVANVIADYNTTIAAPTAPTKTGNTFGGWYKDAALTTVWNFTTDKVTAATTVYAKWTVDTYTVTFDAAGGSTVASKTAAYNGTITAPTAPTKAGFSFIGWFTAATGGTAVTFPYTVVANTTMFAQYDPVYTVTFSGSTVANATITGNGHVVTKPADPTKTGYTFDGWYKDAAFATAWNFTTDTISANTTIFAKWTAIPYTVTIYAADGTVLSTATNPYDSTIAEPAAQTKAGYNFAGWYTAATGGTKITFPYKVAGITTIYPQFTLIQTSSEPTSSDNGTSSTPDGNPVTGDSTPAGIAFILLLVAAAGVVVTRKKARA